MNSMTEREIARATWSTEDGGMDTVQVLVALVQQLAARDARLARVVEALRAWQTRLAFVGHPQEPRLTDGTPDWSRPVALTDAALADAGVGKEAGGSVG